MDEQEIYQQLESLKQELANSAVDEGAREKMLGLIDRIETHLAAEYPDALAYGAKFQLGPGGTGKIQARFVGPDPALRPGEAFDYNSSNADVLGWLIARISGENLADFIQRNIWAKLGAEHDAFIIVDRAYMPVATGGMNSTLRDAAKFGMMIRDRGSFAGEQVIPSGWVDATLDVSPRLLANMKKNPKYGSDPWAAYHNMWWILDQTAGEYCAVGVYGQVIYINRSTDTVMSWFSSQEAASAAGNPVFHSKLRAARELAKQLAE